MFCFSDSEYMFVAFRVDLFTSNTPLGKNTLSHSLSKSSEVLNDVASIASLASTCCISSNGCTPSLLLSIINDIKLLRLGSPFSSNEEGIGSTTNLLPLLNCSVLTIPALLNLFQIPSACGELATSE